MKKYSIRKLIKIFKYSKFYLFVYSETPEGTVIYYRIGVDLLIVTVSHGIMTIFFLILFVGWTPQLLFLYHYASNVEESKPMLACLLS